MLETFWLIPVVIIAIPTAIIVVELLGALLPSPKTGKIHLFPRPRCAVVVPAHDEQASIARTVKNVQRQLSPTDRLIIVADNCQDSTAESARRSGAIVLERVDPILQGKGYALDRGVRSLESDPPEVVVFVDADCEVEEGFVDNLVHEAAFFQCPVQSCNLVVLSESATLKEKLSWFAFQLKNLARPTGLSRLGLPCQLTNGIAFPWRILSTAPLASGNIVEDMQLGIDLAMAGCAARFCPDAKVHSKAPASCKAALEQRVRWEHGHLRILLTQTPRLIAKAIRTRRVDLLALALDVSVPPLSVLFLLWVLTTTGAAILGTTANLWLACYLSATMGLVFFLAVIFTWFKFGRDGLSSISLLAVPFYVLWKIPLYVQFFVRPEQRWVRGDRPVAHQ